MKAQLTFLICFLALTTSAQQFGTPITEEQALEAVDVTPEMAEKANENIKLKGTVQEVCRVKGCWMTMALGNGQNMRVTFKDYGFFVPTDSHGKTAVVAGELKTETISIATLKHLAEDAGKSEQEIAAINEPKTELVFVADGVLLLQ